MTSQVKTDNTAIGPKLELRRHFLDKYHDGAAGNPLVFDACQGKGVLWTRLRSEYPRVRYFGVDKVAKRPGQLQMDSRRLLALPGWKLDVVDIDTYGAPWSHWEQTLRNVPAPLTVFLTVGTTHYGGSVDKAALRALGLEPLCGMIPVSFGRRLSSLALDYSLQTCYLYSKKPVECLRTKRGNATYLGIRLEPS